MSCIIYYNCINYHIIIKQGYMGSVGIIGIGMPNFMHMPI